VVLLFPSLKGALAAANTAKCTGNLKQMYVAGAASASDHDGIVPPGGSNPWVWCLALAPYLAPGEATPDAAMAKCKKVFACPSSPNGCYTSNKQNPPYPAWPYTADYAINNSMPGATAKIVKFCTLRHPAQTPWIEDTVFQNNFDLGCFKNTPAATNNTDPCPPSMNLSFSMRHNGGGNILWFDGHVSYMKFNDYRNFCRSLANTDTNQSDGNVTSIVIGEAKYPWISW